MAKGTVPADVVGSLLGGGTSLQPGKSWVYDIPAPTGQSGGLATPGDIKIYGTSTLVDPSYFPAIQSGLQANMFATSGIDESENKPMPSLQPTNEWMALVLSIIDTECKFGQIQAANGDIYKAEGGGKGVYPNPGRWIPNRSGYAGPMQMAVSTGGGNVVYGDVYDFRTNIHGGIHHLWWFGNNDMGGASKHRDSTGQQFGFINNLAWTIQSYNMGPGGSNPDYLNKVWNLCYPWYLQQLQSSSAPSTTSAIAGDAGAKIIEACMTMGEKCCHDPIDGSTPTYEPRPWAGACVRAARNFVNYALGNGDINYAYDVIIRAATAGEIAKELMKRTLPTGWRVVPPGSPNGVAFHNIGGSGHVWCMVNGMIYDQWSARDKKPGLLSRTSPPIFQIVHSAWDGSTASAPATGFSSVSPGENGVAINAVHDYHIFAKPLQGSRR